MPAFKLNNRPSCSLRLLPILSSLRNRRADVMTTNSRSWRRKDHAVKIALVNHCKRGQGEKKLKQNISKIFKNNNNTCRSDPYIFSLATNPFYLWLICTIFSEAGEDFIPKTLTQLYTWVMLVFANRCVRKDRKY